MNSKYLPSKVFMIRVAIVLVVIATVFGVIKTIKYFKNRPTKNTPVKVLVKDVVQKDSNNNGIADWEEYLWGLNPEKNGESNKEFIMAKKNTIGNNGAPTINNGTDSAKEAEGLSKEFLALVVSLVQTGSMTEKSVSQVSSMFGEKIVPETIPDTYTRDMLTISNSEEADLEYFQELQKLNKKYEGSDMGGELTIMAQGLQNNNPQALIIASTIASSYRSFGQELIKIPVSNKIATGSLNLANDYEKIAQSIEKFPLILDNPLEGMKAILNYKKYSDGILSDIASISSNLE